MKNLKDILMSANPVQVLTSYDQSDTLKELEPSLAALRMTIPKGYHHKDNLTHSIQVLKNAITHEDGNPDLILRTAALFHDIGKPATRVFGANHKVTFTNHEVVGARMVRTILKKHGYTRKEINQISLLVAYHMRSHGFEEKNWTDSAVRRLVKDAQTPENLNRLIVLFYADTTTKNKTKENRFHQSIARLQREITRITSADARKALRPALNGHEVMELLHLTPGEELGRIMKFLNSDEGIHLTREEAINAIQNR